MSAEPTGTFRLDVDILEEIGLDDGVTALTQLVLSDSQRNRVHGHLAKINRARAVEATQAQKADQKKPRRGGRAATFWTLYCTQYEWF
jgi:hypothetical protein